MNRRLRRALWVFDVGFRRMNADRMAGWHAHMGLFSSLALAIWGCVAIGLPLAWPLAIVSAIDLCVTAFVLRGCMRRIRRLGMLGASRARWWIELAALDWTLCVSCGLFWFAHGNPALALPGWQRWFVMAAFETARNLFLPFLLFTAAGMLLGLWQGRRLRGRSIELVNLFFWMIVGVVAALSMIPEHPALVAWVAPAFAIVAIAACCLAGMLALKQRLAATSRSPQ